MKAFTFPDGTALRLADIATVGPLTLVQHFYKWTDDPVTTMERVTVHRRRLWYAPWIVRTWNTTETVKAGGGRSGTVKPEWASYQFTVQDAQGRTLITWPPPAVVHAPPPSPQQRNLYTSITWDRPWVQVATVHGTVSFQDPTPIQWAPRRPHPNGAMQEAGPTTVPENGFEHCRLPAVTEVRDALVKTWAEA